MFIRFFLFNLFFISVLFSAPSGVFYFDELPSNHYPDFIDDANGGNDGFAMATLSTGNSNGKICSALDFSENTKYDYAKIGKNTLDGANDFTVSMWLKGTSSSGRALLSGARAGQDNAILIWFPNDTSVHITIDNVSSTNTNIPSIADNIWHHFVMKRSGSNICTYLDGVLRGCETVSINVLGIDSLIIGQDQDNVGGSFQVSQDWEGIIDEVVIFKNALSDAEVISIYNNQNNGKTWDGQNRSCQTQEAIDNGYSDWHFDEIEYDGTTDEVIDSYGSNHGTGSDVISFELGKICTALDLTSSTNNPFDYITLDASSLNNIGDFTISVWHQGSPGDNSKSLLSGAGSNSKNELIFWMSNQSKFAGYLNGTPRYVTLSSSINNDTWEHLVWRREGINNCFFRDGALVNCVNNYKTRKLLISHLILGQEQDAFGGGFDANQDWEGKLDELIIFRHALSDTEINDIYTNQDNGNNWDGSPRVCPSAVMSITKTSCVINDPVSGTSNPKSIPGATIRYALQVQNIGVRDANNVLVSDTIESKFDSSTIRNIQIQNGNCDCLNMTSASNNGANGSNNGVNPIVLDFGTVSAGTVAIPTKKCGYFEVDLQ